MKTKRDLTAALIFDYDGVVNIGTEILINKMIALAWELGYPTPSVNYLQSGWGMSWEELLQKMSIDLSWSTAMFDEYLHYINAIDPTSFNFKAPGLDEFFLRARQSHLLAIITNRLRKSLTKCMAETDFNQNYFAHIQARDDYIYHKPDIRCLTPVLSLIQIAGIPLDKVTYIGDTANYDYKMIKESGLPISFKAILSGGNSKEMFLAAGISEGDILNNVTDFQI